MKVGEKKIETMSLPFNSDYSAAVFGLLHVAFVDKNGNYCLMEEDRKSIEASLSFYQNQIKKSGKYPIYENDCHERYVSSNDKEAFLEVLGLPEPMLKTLDLSKDILSQIHFVNNNLLLKEECYSSVYDKGKWFNDCFRCFCMNNGVFLSDVIPCFRYVLPELPIYFDRSRMNERYKQIYDSALTERLVISFTDGISKENLNLFYKLDDFSLGDRVNHFLNNVPNREINELSLTKKFAELYKSVLKMFISTFIESILNEYLSSVLGKSVDFISLFDLYQIPENTKKIYSVSSYNEEMYTYDKIHFFFALSEKQRIKKIMTEKIKEKKNDSLISLYASFKFPYEGYQYIKECKKENVDELLSLLPFEEVSETNCYMSVKRYAFSGAYIPNREEHNIVCENRALSIFGIDYLGFDWERPNDCMFTIRVRKANRPESLKALFDDETMTFTNTILPGYLSLDYVEDKQEVKKFCEMLDEASSNRALIEFYKQFDEACFDDAMEFILEKYDLLEGECFLDSLFFYALTYPQKLAGNEIRYHFIKNQDTLSLACLDSFLHLEKREDSLPYPYVEYGDIFNSYKKHPFDKPCLCECQRDAVLNRIDYYEKCFQKMHEDDKKNCQDYIVAKQKFILDHLGLSKDVSSRINLFQDLASQLTFKANLCHVCNHARPTVYHDNQGIDLLTNIYENYLISRLSQAGVYLERSLAFDQADRFICISEFITSIEEKKYHTLIHFDKDSSNKMLAEFLPMSMTSVLSLLCAFYGGNGMDMDFIKDVSSFSLIDDKLLLRLLYDCTENMYQIINNYSQIFVLLCEIFRSFETALAIEESKDFLPVQDSLFCMNRDYNKTLPHPVILLGKQFDAYMDEEGSTIYFSIRDKKPLQDFGNYYLDMLKNSSIVEKKALAPILLGSLGLPYQVIHKYESFDFWHKSFDQFLSRLKFEDGIDRCDFKIKHSVFKGAFRKAFPSKEDRIAEYRLAIMDQIRDGFKINSTYDLNEINLETASTLKLDDPLYALPFFECLTKEIPEVLVKQIYRTKESMAFMLRTFYGKMKKKNDALKKACHVIYDEFLMNNRVLLDFIVPEHGRYQCLRELVEDIFPAVNNFNNNQKDKIEMSIISFVFYLFEDLIEQYVEKEYSLGRSL